MSRLQNHSSLDQCAEYARLGKGLPVHLPDPCGGAVGGYHHQGHLLVVGFRHGRMQVEQGSARGAAYGYGRSVVQGKPEGEESRAPFVGQRIAREVGHVGKGLRQRDVPASGTEHNPPDAVRAQQCRQL